MALLWLAPIQSSYRATAWSLQSFRRTSFAQTNVSKRWATTVSSQTDTSIANRIELTQEQQNLVTNWRSVPAINPTFVFPTLLVPSDLLERWIQDPVLRPHLAIPSNWEVLYQIQPRIHMVQKHDEKHKVVLLRNDENAKTALTMLVESEDALEMGPEIKRELTYKHLSFAYILGHLLPVPPPSAFEQIGHVAHFNLKPQHYPYRELIGQVLRETNPSIDTVVNKVGEVKGKYRTYDLEVLAGPPQFETILTEHGIRVQLNVADCYWCSRLSGERKALFRYIEERARGREELVVADVFSGVGAVCLMVAKRQQNCTILANDWNPTAIEYMKKSIALNGLRKSQFELTCLDSYEFLIDLGSRSEVPDHVLMNFPSEAPGFLGALRWWSATNIKEKFDRVGQYPRFHVYTFAKSEHRDADDEEEVAIDIVANGLLPSMGGSKTDQPIQNLREDLDTRFNAELHTRVVRDVAPGKVVVCVSFSLTPKLVEHVQGNFS